MMGASVSPPSLPPEDREILRALVLGLRLQRKDDRWAFGDTSDAGVPESVVSRLLDQKFVWIDADTQPCVAEITDAGRAALWEVTKDITERSIEWLHSGLRIDTS